MARQRSGFEKLDVFRAAEEMADVIWGSVRVWKLFDRDTIGKQMVRAADSVGANIAEGYGRGRSIDQRRFVRIAIGSLYETKYWLRRAFHRGLLTQVDVDRLKPLLDRLLPMLNAYCRSITRPTPDLRPTTPE